MRLARSHAGAALLTALFIMTLVAIAVTAMTTRTQQEIYRTRLIIAHDSLYLASQAVTFWSLHTLQSKEYPFSKLRSQGMVAEYPKNLANTVQAIQLSGGIYDLQAQFNLNNLANPRGSLTFVNLLNQALPALANKPELAKSLQIWMAPYAPDRGHDDYTAYGLAQNPPYYPGYQPLQSKSELRLVKGVEAATYLALEPLITALPQAALPINLNTAPKPLLRALGNGLSEEQVNEIIKARECGQGIKNLDDIDMLLKKINLSREQITLKSDYFLSVAVASNKDFTVRVYTLIHRQQRGDSAAIVSIIRESTNAFVF